MASKGAIRPLHSICAARARRQAIRRPFSTRSPLYARDPHLPRVASTSFWSSLIPKPLRRSTDPGEAAERAQIKATKSKQWNPYTIFIILGIIVGSNSIQIISLRNDMLNYSRKTEAKLSLLREVVQKVKNGEHVDVRKALGTGDPEHEAEWEEVMKELETTDPMEEDRRKREAKTVDKAEKKRSREEEKIKARDREGSPQSLTSETSDIANERRPKFMM